VAVELICCKKSEDKNNEKRKYHLHGEFSEEYVP